MRIGLILSIVFHSALLGFALLSFQNAKAFKQPVVDSIPIDLIDISELTKLKAGLKKAPERQELKKPDPKPIAKTTEPEKKKKKPAPQRKVEAAAEEPPAPIVEKIPPKVKEKEKPKKVAEKPKPKPKVKPKPKPVKKKVTKKKKKKKKFNEDKIAALLNKVPDAASSSSKLPDLPGAKKVKGSPRGLDRVSMMNIQGAIVRQVSPCWNTLAGGEDAENLIVKLQIKLNRDGTLTGTPKVLNRVSSPFFGVAADRALRAIYQCQPYNLPQKDYDHWKFMNFSFNPAAMFR